VKVSTPWDAQWHLRAELARILEQLGQYLSRQRQRGRTAVADAVRGLVIEDGEAEGLLADLAAALSRPAATGREARSAVPARRAEREEIAERAALGAGQGAFLPLHHAARAFALEPEEYDALLLALAVEIDARFGRLVAYLNDHVSRTRPTLGLALALRDGDEIPMLSPIELCERPLVRDGLLELEGEGPLPGQALRIPPRMLPRLLGSGASGAPEVGLSFFPAELGLLQRLVLEESLRQRLAAWGETKRQGRPAPPLLFHGAPGSGRRTAARAAASEAGLPLVVAEVSADNLTEKLRAARREARWHGAALLLRVDAAGVGSPPAAFDWRALWAGSIDPSRPLFLALETASIEDATSAAPGEPGVLHIPEPETRERARLWQVLLPPGERLTDAELADLAGRFRFHPGRIARAVQRAVAELTLRPPGERRLGLVNLEQACRDVGSAAMGSLAQKLPLPYERHELVVPPQVRTELDLAIAWVRHQHHVLGDWGFARRLPAGRGLTALFSGPPGTGKTMAVQVLAGELGLDLYRVDLSRVMSKYIGETEKHLGQLFDEAHASGVILFFDEADALFGKRSEVKDAHDRYANVEIGYLLQRMEEHDGVTILATNRARDMDEAFLRRFHIMADFPMPGEADRLRIWEGMFPKEAAREPNLDFAPLARDYEMTGGEIKNAALASAYLAAAGGKPVAMEHVLHALRRELLKSGRVVD
jgi:AAA+ superfamily predicted ATPase